MIPREPWSCLSRWHLRGPCLRSQTPGTSASGDPRGGPPPSLVLTSSQGKFLQQHWLSTVSSPRQVLPPHAPAVSRSRAHGGSWPSPRFHTHWLQLSCRPCSLSQLVSPDPHDAAKNFLSKTGIWPCWHSQTVIPELPSGTGSVSWFETQNYLLLPLTTV